MAKKKFYAVAVGVRPGIYESWPKAQAQVKGYAGAVFKGFSARAEAEEWLKNPSYGPKAKPKGKAPKSSVKGPEGPRSGVSHDAIPEDGRVVIYTDGGAINNPGPGGFGAVLLSGSERLELSGGFRLTTNNRMELMACIRALEEIPWSGMPIDLYSDSSYVVNGIKKGWARSWRRNGWRKSDRQPAINADLWARLLELIEGVKVTFHWVKGHAGNPLNERCDRLAVAAARGSELQEDRGYKGAG